MMLNNTRSPWGPQALKPRLLSENQKGPRNLPTFPAARACWDLKSSLSWHDTNASPGATLTTSGEIQMVQAHTRKISVSYASSKPTSSSML